MVIFAVPKRFLLCFLLLFPSLWLLMLICTDPKEVTFRKIQSGVNCKLWTLHIT